MGAGSHVKGSLLGKAGAAFCRVQAKAMLGNRAWSEEQGPLGKVQESQGMGMVVEKDEH